MSRKEFSGGGRLFGNGTLLADATNISFNVGGNTTRVVTTGGNTGEIKNDPTMAKISVQHAVPKSGSDLLTIRRWHRAGVDVRWKIVVGNNTATVIGKVSSFKLDAAPGKGEASFEIEGDEQSPG